jgi:hypothetical protein
MTALDNRTVKQRHRVPDNSRTAWLARDPNWARCYAARDQRTSASAIRSHECRSHDANFKCELLHKGGAGEMMPRNCGTDWEVHHAALVRSSPSCATAE